MTVTQLKYVTTIAECGSLSKAAEILYIAQPSLTSALKELEKEIGITIFNRGGRGVSLTADGTEFLMYARGILSQYDSVLERYGKATNIKKKFGVSAQHYSFAVKAFVEMVKQSDPTKYEFAMRETKTRDIISDVANQRSEIGILYLNNFNRVAINKLLRAAELEFHKLIDCDAYVYLWKNHPLASKDILELKELKEYPCIAFEQGDNASFYYAEELYSTHDYERVIRVCDRGTVLNLMVGLNGYTLCSGIICEELNGSDYIAVPLKGEEADFEAAMEIGYITKKNQVISGQGERYIQEIKKYLEI